ncbi:hypothetical protein WMF27_31810 [Sorangium sp. So ce281]|uniref:hypothetical protein n=1 Tax=unclassified Sorangium TaxID=2621164 RepID=UPI003F5F6269
MTRLERFRAYMARMNPVADPGAALREKLYVTPPGRSVADELATRLELEPASTHLVIGGIGSGKTSELLMAAERLGSTLPEAGDLAEYIDVSRRHDLDASGLSGVLVALAGQSLVRQVLKRYDPEPKSPLAQAVEAVRHHAHGYRTWVADEPYPDDDEPPELDEDAPYGEYLHVPGVIVSPDEQLPSSFKLLATHLRTIRAIYPGEGKHIVFLFDSLDRLPSAERFREAVKYDLRALKTAGLGVAVVGPVRFMSGTDRAITDLFDQTHFLIAHDPTSSDGLAFLTQVLRKRAEPGALPDECLAPLARASGGVMRDLIALAKRAGQEAYSVGHDQIMLEDVAKAVDAFGRSLAVGLDDEQVKTLHHIRRGKGFVIRGERELSLLETGRVVLHGESRFAVHPALAPLLDAIPEAA